MEDKKKQYFELFLDDPRNFVLNKAMESIIRMESKIDSETIDEVAFIEALKLLHLVRG